MNESVARHKRCQKRDDYKIGVNLSAQYYTVFVKSDEMLVSISFCSILTIIDSTIHRNS